MMDAVPSNQTVYCIHPLLGVTEMRDLLYISCHPQDESYLQLLREVLRRDVRLADAVWDATEVPAGSNRKLEIEQHGK